MSKYYKSNKVWQGTIVWASVTAFILAFLIVFTVLANTLLSSILGTVLGGPKPIKNPESKEYYSSEYDSKEASKEAGDELNVKIAEEGFTLLLNENNALPLDNSKEKKISVFGKNSVNLVLGGSGSGGISGDSAKTLFDGLEKGGFEYNPVLKEFYENNSKSGAGRSDSPELKAGTDKAPTLDIGETPMTSYTKDVRDSFNEYNDAAIVVISRLGGESWDLPRSQNVDNGGIEGNHYLQLDNNEYALLDYVTSKFSKVIVVLNTLTAFQCDFIAQYNNTISDNPRIDAVMWIGGPGTTGAEAFGDLLSGNVNPSGRMVDIYAKDFTKDPTWQNFGDNSQVNGGSNGTAILQNGTASGQNMITYEEGIYVGYRYYETRAYKEAVDGTNVNWYNQNVVFPFGHGLSYTEFRQEITSVEGSLEGKNGSITIKVEVENIGDRAGKDVVELYVTKPYTLGGIEKPYVELVDFAKTDELTTTGDGNTQTITFKVDAYDLASYDYNDANGNGLKGYELEAGDYVFYVSANSHVDEYAYDSKTVTLAKDVYWENDPVTDYPVKNLYTTNDFNDLQYRLETVSFDVGDETYERKGMSRANFEVTFPHAFDEAANEREARNLGYFFGDNAENASLSELEAIASVEHNNPVIKNVTEMPKTGASGSIVLKDLLDDDGRVEYGDGNDEISRKWDELLDRIKFDEMLELVNNGAFQTAPILSVGKNLTNDSDGPIGFVNFMPGMSDHYKGNTTFACEIVIGSTWNKDLAYQMGKIVGENGLWGDVNGNGLPYSGWYAPAVNLHRSPFSGRNFEYYSEDPIISGKLAVNVITGARSKGVYTDLKHFALNDQETNRAGVCTFCTEQALRELYLKPFEIAVKAKDNVEHNATLQKDINDNDKVNIKGFLPTTGIMSSFNRIGTKWTGGDYRLCTEILRNEWGFRGLVICDYKTETYMNSRQMLYAGNDLILTSLGNLMWTDAKSDSAQDVTILRQATKNILYTVANSNSMNAEIIGYRMEWWKAMIIALDVIVPVGLAVWGFFAIRTSLKRKKQKDEQMIAEGLED